MIQLATALPAISVGPVKPNAAISVDVSGFALALGVLTAKVAAPATAVAGKAADAAVPLAKGQDVAEPGKELPDAVLGLEGKGEDQPAADTDEDPDTGTGDTPSSPFAWFATAPLPVPEPEAKSAGGEVETALTLDAGGKTRARPEIKLPEAAAEPAAGQATPPTPEAIAKAASQVAAPRVTQPVAQPEIKQTPTVSRQPKADVAAAVPAPVDPEADKAVADALGAKVVTTAAATPAVVQPPVAQAPRELRKAAAGAPVVRIALDKPASQQTPQQPVSIADVTQGQRQAATAPAAQSVAEQVFAAFEQPRSRAGSNAAGDPQADLSTLAAQSTGTQTVAAVAAAGQGQDATLDMRHQQWTAKMIDKIEALQDAAPLRETRLSLMPEGLGKVDIAIHQDEAGGLHVQFNTDTQAARQLIADAQPKLAEIAQERGIRLGSTSVESNAAGTGSNANSQMNQGQQNDARPQRNQPSAPPSARREAPSSTQDDERVA